MVLIMKPLGGKTALLPMSCAISATNVHGVALMTEPPNEHHQGMRVRDFASAVMAEEGVQSIITIYSDSQSVL